MKCTITSVLEEHCANGKSVGALGHPTIEIVQSLDSNRAKRWTSFVTDNNSFLSLSYLQSMEEANGKELELRYVLFSKGEKLIGIAAFQITHFATSADAYTNPVMRFLHQSVQYLKLGHVHNILICGNAIATGEHGFLFHQEIAMVDQAKMLVQAMNKIAEEEKNKRKRICAMVVKDFYPQSEQLPLEFKKFGFKSFSVDHNMVLPLPDEWKTFEDYLNALVTKFRTKAKSALNKSASLVIEKQTSDSIIPLIPSLQKLYENVHYKADFRLGKMNLEALPLLLKQMPEDFFVTTYSLNNEVVGFLTAMRCGDSLDAHVIGLDYTYNKDYAIYQRILYDYVALGISLRCNRLVLGRTAAEIKSTIGAFPVDLTCAILHQRTISNALLKMILHYVGPSQYEHRQPYKVDALKRAEDLVVY